MKNIASNKIRDILNGKSVLEEINIKDNNLQENGDIEDIAKKQLEQARQNRINQFMEEYKKLVEKYKCSFVFQEIKINGQVVKTGLLAQSVE